ncbi:uncharacterized protein TNCV_3841371 [Trichonephila clavipes]|nr:uncharacterized protein TNCV_3841371 [Trichonephila clavipes]
MIVLAWLRKEPMDLKSFVQNRIAKIQELYPNQLWRHVPSDQNPADLVSRGVDPDKLLQQNLWFNGPTFLSGRPRNTNDREDRAIRRVATSAPTTSLASIQRHLPPSRHPVPSRETIRRRLTEVGLRSRRPLRRLPLTPHHRQCRLDFADLGQSVTDWRRVIFSDESRLSLSADDHRTHVSGGAPASGPIRHLLSSGIQQFHKV